MQKLDATNYYDELLSRLPTVLNNPNSISTMMFVFEKTRYCYRVSIERDEFNRFLLNSSTEQRELAIEEYPILKDVVDSIKAIPAFLSKSNFLSGGLNGIQVKRYLAQFDQNPGLDGLIFIIDKDEITELIDSPNSMREEGSYYIVDGMHRLVAYGLSPELNDESFPIEVYYCTNSSLL